MCDVGKWKAVVTEIRRMNKTGRPVLVGTTSVEKSETLAARLKEAGIQCQVCVSLLFHAPLVCVISLPVRPGMWFSCDAELSKARSVQYLCLHDRGMPF